MFTVRESNLVEAGIIIEAPMERYLPADGIEKICQWVKEQPDLPKMELSQRRPGGNIFFAIAPDDITDESMQRIHKEFGTVLQDVFGEENSPSFIFASKDHTISSTVVYDADTCDQS